MTTPAEQKSKKRQSQSILVNIFIATMMISFAFSSTFFEFETLKSKVIMAVYILTATIITAYFLIKWLKSLDEYEKQINAHACMVALYSSLFYLPLQYISEIGLIPEIHVAFFFMFLWLVYLLTVIKHHFK